MAVVYLGVVHAVRMGEDKLCGFVFRRDVGAGVVTVSKINDETQVV